MHPRAQIGMPHANPRTGMPRLRRSWRRARSKPPLAPQIAPARARLRAPAAPLGVEPSMCAYNQGQGWSLVYTVKGIPVESFKATTSGSTMMYGQTYWYLNVPPRPELPSGFSGWLPRCGTGPRI